MIWYNQGTLLDSTEVLSNHGKCNTVMAFLFDVGVHVYTLVEDLSYIIV